MTTPAEREFHLWRRGQIRDEVILAALRNGLAELVDPETGQTFSEERIRVATQPGSRDYIEADAIDVLGMSWQARAKFLAAQVVTPQRANRDFLRKVWMPLYGLTPLPGQGGRGTVNWKADPGTPFLGSTEVPDPTGQAHTLRDAARNEYQVVVGGTVGAGGTIELTVEGVSTGPVTNLAPGTKLTAVNKPLAAEPTALVATQFTDGVDPETDAEAIDRLIDRIRRKPGSGNGAHFRSWARDASTLVQTAFVYSTALHAGSTLVTPLAKRGTNEGPLARIPSASLISTVRAFIVPPGSRIVPGRVHVLVIAPTSVSSDVVLRLGMRRNSAGGWADLNPWPGFAAAAAAVSTVTSQTDFVINSDTTLPGGVSSLSGSSAPRLMMWDKATSQLEVLAVSSVDDSPGGGDYRVQLSAAPAKTIAVGNHISPETALRTQIREAVETYFDDLGPGEVIDLATDVRADRAFRFPETREENPAEAGQAVLTPLIDALRFAVSNVQMAAMSVTDPGLPSDPSEGPRLITLGHLAVYDL